MSKTVEGLRTPKEKVYQLVMLAVGALLWVVIALAALAALASGEPRIISVVVMYALYGIGFWIFYEIVGAAYRATAFGNMILLGPDQFPELHNMVVAGSQQLNLGKTPTTFLYNSHGIFNAFARRLLGGRYVFLTSALVEASSDEQVRFVIGHELGHHAAGHLNPWLNTVKLPAYAMPFLGAAYSRSREYTCDSIGAFLCKDTASAQTALQMLGCGCRRLNERMRCEPFIAQERLVPPIFGFLTEIFRSHPRLTRRVAAIKAVQPSSLDITG